VKTETEVRTALRDWIVRTSGKVHPADVANDTPILERRIVKSLDIMDLILFLEELRGAPIDVEKLKPGVFRDIDAIWKNFFGPPSQPS
jgi:acyl carrier protein